MTQMSRADINNLPDSDFAYIEPGGSKDSGGRTTPRSKRHFPIQDAAHVRDALARIAQGAKFGQEALPKVRAAAKKFGVDVSKALGLGIEHKSFQFKLDAPPDDEGRFTGSAAVFGNIDKGNDLIEAGAVTKTLQENPEVPLFWQHDYGMVPIGIGRLTPDGSRVKIDGQLLIDSSDRAREVFGAMKAKAVKGLSIGYNTLQRSFVGKVRHLQEIAIDEVSLCNKPMNPLALVESTKDAKWLGQYESTQEVDCLLSVIGDLTDYLASEVAEGDDDDVARVQRVLPILAQCLASEFDDVASGNADHDSQSSAVEMMREPVELAVKKLTALLDVPEPADATQDADGAAEQETSEPDLSTLKARFAAVKAA